MNILIIGFGRAGKRHAKLLDSMGIRTGILDPVPPNQGDISAIYKSYYPAIYDDFNQVVRDNIWDAAVIATPPHLHLDYIRKCLQNSMWVACEKPLTSFGNIYDVIDLMNSNLPLECVQVQYNYRFNPDMQELDGSVRSDAWQFVATQHREVLPDWGLMLDHLSHDVDIIRWVSKRNFYIQEVTHVVTEDIERIVINGQMSDYTPVYIMDEVNFVKEDHPRIAKLFSPQGYMDVTANSKMFTRMWESFFENHRLGLPQYPSVKDAFETQEILQDAFEKTRVVAVSEQQVEGE